MGKPKRQHSSSSKNNSFVDIVSPSLRRSERIKRNVHTLHAGDGNHSLKKNRRRKFNRMQNVSKNQNQQQQNVGKNSLKKKYSRPKMYLMKEAIKHPSKIPTYRLPKSKLKNALDILDNENYFKNVSTQRKSCLPSVYEIDSRKHEIVTSTLGKLLKEARKCVLKHDWNNLAKILCVAKPLNSNSYEIYFNVIKRYAEICLINNPDKTLIDNFIKGVLTPNSTEADDMVFQKFRKCLDNDHNSNSNTSDDNNSGNRAGDRGNSDVKEMKNDGECEIENDRECKVENDEKNNEKFKIEKEKADDDEKN